MRCYILCVVYVILFAYKTHGQPQQPLVAFMCNKPTMYMSDNGWVEDRTTDCIKEPERILKYCQKVYPHKDITNVVESSELVTIDDWCRFDKPKCHKHNSHTVRPFRCLIGPFQSDALLVPEHCLFDHKHGKKCGHYADWNSTAFLACDGHNMKLQSFSMLQPCGTDIFNGVEFVCCPKPSTAEPTQPSVNHKPKTTTRTHKDTPFIVEDDSNLLKVSSDKKSHQKPTNKPVLKKSEAGENSIFYEHYIRDSKDDSFLNEHEYFFKAKNDLQKHHHDRVTKMMKQWAEARQKVADMKAVDPKGAEKLNKQMTARFQKTYEALEEEGMAEKKQLISIHQRRITSDLNDKKRLAMERYMDTLTDSKSDASKVLKTLKHYIKTEEKDRLHALNHFKHILDTNPEEQGNLRKQTQTHLKIIQERINTAIGMLNRVPGFEKKIKQQIEEYLATFRELDSAISATIDSPVEQKIETESKPVVPPVETKTVAKKPEHKPVQKKVLKPQESAENEIYHEKSASEINDEDDENEHYFPEMKIQHADYHRNNEMNVQLQDPAVKSRPLKQKSFYSSSTSVIVAVAAVAVFVIIVAGILVLRKRSQRSGRAGFVEVDQVAAASPEERHVANMQMNGYENPTYRYFETQQPA